MADVYKSPVMAIQLEVGEGEVKLAVVRGGYREAEAWINDYAAKHKFRSAKIIGVFDGLLVGSGAR